MQNQMEELAAVVQRFQSATGEDALVVVIEKHDQGMGIHRVGYEATVGLLVDGKPPTARWYQEAEGFHPLQFPPLVLH